VIDKSAFAHSDNKANSITDIKSRRKAITHGSQAKSGF
jgi:hypothetical protein